MGHQNSVMEFMLWSITWSPELQRILSARFLIMYVSHHFGKPPHCGNHGYESESEITHVFFPYLLVPFGCHYLFHHCPQVDRRLPL